MTKNVSPFPATAVVLAAGRATRFKTRKSKLLFNICGRSMILYPLKVLESLGISMTVVTGHQAEQVEAAITEAEIENVSFARQEEQRGTGHAVACSADSWQQDHVLIVSGDAPLITQEVIQDLLNAHLENDATVSFLKTRVLDPQGYGRVIEQNGSVQVIEEKDCTDDQRSITLVNAGVYVLSKEFLKKHIGNLGPSAVTQEIYLPDLIKRACEQGCKVLSRAVPFDTIRGINTLQELWEVEQIKRSELIKYWMQRGVRFELAQSIHLDLDVRIGAGSFIGTGAHLLRGTSIGEECFISAFSILANTRVGDETTIHSHSVIQDSIVGNHAHVGPFARIRDNVSIGDYAEVGNFVEMKKTVLGEKSKAKHLSYLGDAQVGMGANIGAGTITCNYDGAKKHVTEIQDGAFVGSNNTLVAPLTIEKNSYTAAGSTITKNVPEKSLAIARSQQLNKEGYADKLPRKSTVPRASQTSDAKIVFKAAVKTEQEYSEGV